MSGFCCGYSTQFSPALGKEEVPTVSIDGLKHSIFLLLPHSLNVQSSTIFSKMWMFYSNPRHHIHLDGINLQYL